MRSPQNTLKVWQYIIPTDVHVIVHITRVYRCINIHSIIPPILDITCRERNEIIIKKTFIYFLGKISEKCNPGKDYVNILLNPTWTVRNPDLMRVTFPITSQTFK